MSHSQFHSHLSEDMKRLEARLETLCRGRLLPKETGSLRLLDLACGECFEAETLARLMRKTIDPGRSSSVLEIDFVGMDMSKQIFDFMPGMGISYQRLLNWTAPLMSFLSGIKTIIWAGKSGMNYLRRVSINCHPTAD